MSTPQDRDRPDEGDGTWQEPAHLSGNEPAGEEPNIADRRSQPRDEDHTADRRSQPRDEDHTADRETWQPPGWDLPPPAEAERHPDAVRREDASPEALPPQAFPPQPQERMRGGLFGSRPRTRDPEMERAFTYAGDVVGAQQWALANDWTISDGSGPEDAALRGLIDSAPVRLTKDHRPGTVLRGRSGALELVALDVVYASGRYLVPEYAVTAAPLLGSVPVLRLSPARLWKHGVGGLAPVPSGDDAFDTRWVLLAAEVTPQVQRLAQDPVVHGLLLGTDDGDEFWTGAGHLAAIRPDGHRPALLEHHSRLLAALVQALAAGY